MSCENCPYIRMLESKKEKYVEEISEINKVSAEFGVRVIGLEAEFTLGSEEGTEYDEETMPAIDSARVATEDLIEVNDQGINLREVAISAIDDDIEYSQRTCSSNGPKIKKRFKVFGRDVIKCGSLSAQQYYFDVPPQDDLLDN